MLDRMLQDGHFAVIAGGYLCPGAAGPTIGTGARAIEGFREHR